MRAALRSSVILIAALSAPVASAAEPRVLEVKPSDSAAAAEPAAGFQTYRGYIFDLSNFAARKDGTTLADTLKSQLDMVENSGLSPSALNFFHSIPIVASETECLDEGASLACYGRAVPDRDRHRTHNLTIWDHEKQSWTNPDPIQLAADSGLGVIVLRPNVLTHAQDPVMLHEFLHAFHARLLPEGYENMGVRGYFGYAKAKNLLPKDSYTLKNQQEFFAVTASIFLAGKESMHDPFTRAALKEKMPDYYKYLVGLFGFDPEAGVTPVASAK